MLDIKLIRENPDKINELLKRRNPELSIDEVIKIDEERRKIQTQADELRAKRKSESQKIGIMKKNGENTDGEVWFYRYREDPDDPNRDPDLTYIDDDEEYESVADAFDEYLDNAEFDELVDEDE